MQTDILVIGSGLAGLAAAWNAANWGCEVTLLTRASNPEDSNTGRAQGGIIYRGDGDSPSANLKLEVYPTMFEDFQLAYHAVQALFGAGVLGTSIKWVHKRHRKSLENRVLSTFRNTDPDGEWQSAHGVVGELGLKAALSDAPGFFPPKEPRLRSRLRTAFYRCRHSFRRAFIIPDKEKADKVLRDLWERGLLVRAGWRHTDNEFYKLRN